MRVSDSPTAIARIARRGPAGNPLAAGASPCAARGLRETHLSFAGKRDAMHMPNHRPTIRPSLVEYEF